MPDPQDEARSPSAVAPLPTREPVRTRRWLRIALPIVLAAAIGAVWLDAHNRDRQLRLDVAQHLAQLEVTDKVAQLSPQDLHQLAQNLDQLQAAGLTKQEWWWIGIGAIAALILIVALS